MEAEHEFDVVVVGAGPIGAATARHLTELGADVLVVGPDEPARFDDHEGVWAGHYDQGRLAHVLEVPLVASLLANRSIRRFPALSESAGIEFAKPTQSLAVMPETIADPASAEWFDRERLVTNAADVGVGVVRLGEADLRQRYPRLCFEPGHVGVVQPEAFIVNPRELVRALLTVSTRNGATLVRDDIVDIRREAGGRRVTARSGQSWRARSVVVATGAATNAIGLLARPLAMDTFGATVVLVEAPDPDEVDLPATMYLKIREGQTLYGGIVMPPLRYPDGRWYFKCAGNSVLETPLDTSDEIARWVRTGGNEKDIDDALSVLTDLLPRQRFGPAHTRPCLVSANHTAHPYIDQVEDDLVVAVEGERGVMAADEIGRLTAELVSTGRWSDSIPHDLLRAVWDAPLAADSLGR
ncbi:NAD(P)/FAD-dependent oxidoreductase [Rhodococcus sp. NPDC127528]|uniref:NAD(P)/FAD-dependent oxidoreductase n=1 Tax=unclassified Rhodococcus (in: high G+C Gram-positive bacteria) TaxID=192944 RepID=UPI003635B3CB